MAAHDRCCCGAATSNRAHGSERARVVRREELIESCADLDIIEAHGWQVRQRKATQAQELGGDMNSCTALVSDVATAAGLLPWTTLERRVCKAERRILDAAKRIEEVATG